MSSSRHPVALSIERRVSSSTKLLAIVMLLPLVDGVFAALVLAGALESTAGILEVGLLIFGGSAMVAVILAEMDHPPRQQAKIVLGIGVVMVVGAAVQAAIAPTIESVLNMIVFERFAALVILSVAATTASSRLSEYLPGPAVIVALGIIASISPSGATLSLQADLELTARAMAAAGIGVVFALVIALTSPYLRNAVDIDRFRFGSAVALGVLAFSVFGLIPGNAPVALAVLIVTSLLAFDPGRARERERVYRPDDIDITAALSDGGNESPRPTESESDAAEEQPEREVLEREHDRPPWF